MYVYKRTEKAGRDGATADLFTVGYYEPGTGEWQSESDWPTREEARTQTAYLNGGGKLTTTFVGRVEQLEERVRGIEEALKIGVALGATAVRTIPETQCQVNDWCVKPNAHEDACRDIHGDSPGSVRLGLGEPRVSKGRRPS